MLKIDLLPKHFAIARKNKQLLALFVIALVVVAGAWYYQATQLSAATEKVKADEAVYAGDAKLVDQYTQETSAKQADLAPIKARLDFVDAANALGPKYWKAFHAVNDYIFDPKPRIGDDTNRLIAARQVVGVCGDNNTMPPRQGFYYEVARRRS